MERINTKVATIVVTYNRSALLKKCLMSIELQTYRPTIVYIIDNASTDNTEEVVNSMDHQIPYEYIKLKENVGGAGGFHMGLKNAHEKNIYDAFWLMDDDGIPDSECLKNLIHNIKYDFISPLVLDIDNKKYLAFPYLSEKTSEEVIVKYGDNGFIPNFANPFNGILLSKHFVEIVGYPMKEMFIWGDEVEYQKRAVSKGLSPRTIISAIHYHPKDRMVLRRDFLGRKKLVYVESPLRRYCKYRNMAYCEKKYLTYDNIFKSMYRKLSYIFFYMVNRKMDIKGLKLYLTAVRDGRNADFTHTHEYNF